MIEFQHVGKEYPDGTVAIEDLSFTVPTGQITVLVGPSGCGKTTTLRMINRLIEPSSGVILIDGRRSDRENPHALRRRIGYVIQSAGLFPHRTVIDNVASVPILTGVARRQAREDALGLLDLVGLDRDMAHRYPWQLSGGQQQRVGIARALAADPPYLLMDEPFSALDPVVRAQLQDELLDIQKRIAKTIVLVTHNVDEALKLGDQIIVLNTGGVLEQAGGPQELIRTPASPLVADFLGSSRGYHALGFDGPDGVHVDPVSPLRIGDRVPQGPRSWHVVVDVHGRPLGWYQGEAGTEVGSTGLNYSCVPVAIGASLRAYLDSALSSPCGVGIVVDGQGIASGTVSTAAVASAFDALTGVQNS